MSNTIIEHSQKLCDAADGYLRNRTPESLNQVRLYRVLMAKELLGADAAVVATRLSEPVNNALMACLKLDVRRLPRIEIEQSIFAACQADLLAGSGPDKGANKGLAGLMLSWHACELGCVPAFAQISPAFRSTWFSYLFETPAHFRDAADVNRYNAYLEKLCEQMAAYITVGPSTDDLIQALHGTAFGERVFGGVILKDVAKARTAIMDALLKNSGQLLANLRVAVGPAPAAGVVLTTPATSTPIVARSPVPQAVPLPASAGEPKQPLNRKQRRAVGKTASPAPAAEKTSSTAAEAVFAAAIQYHQKGQVPEARGHYIEVLKRDPTHGGALNNLGILEADQNNHEVAEALYKRAFDLDPKNANALMNLGNLYKSQDKYEQAQAAFEQTLRVDANHCETYVNLGNVHQHLGRVEHAIGCYQKALSINPDLADAHLNLGNILSRIHRSEEAVTHYENTLRINPNYAAAYNNMGMALLGLGRHDRAITCFERALALRADYLDAYLNLGSLYKDLGKGDEAAKYYEKILAIDPDHPGALSNVAFSLNYSDTASADALAKQHFRAGSRMERKFYPPPQDYMNTRDPGRKLRVGYVSPDLRFHAVANFFEPLMRAHDRNVVEIYCYAEVLTPDTMTAQLQGIANQWRSTVGVSDDALAAQIRNDQIDILVDMAGHSNNNRLTALARHPAPVQVTWLGYPNTTGMKNMDYRLVDAVSDPPGVADSHASETLVRLEGGFLCYNTFVPAPDPVPPPRLKNGFVTFGSFNNLPKLSPATIRTWSKLLKRVPTAKLVLKNRFLGEPGTRELVMQRFAAHEIGADRVTLLAGVPDLTAHMAAYHDIDIGLDSFPYNGTTTTCEALWMGIPVIGLAGDRHLARVGASIMTHAGAPELVARDEDHYVDLAAGLAHNLPRLANYHAELRNRMKASPLCDAARFARAVEAAYREMWKTWCAKSP